MSRPQDVYRSAMNKVAATDGWKARTRAAMEAAAETPRLRVAASPRRAWKGVLAAAACLVLVGIPVLRYGLGGLGMSGGAAAPNMAAYDSAAGAAEPRAMAAAPDEEAGEEAEKAQLASQAAAPAVTALEGLPGEGEATDAMLTRVGEDETSVYYLAGSLEGAVAVYADGSTEPLADALEAGRVTLADLQRLGAPLTAEPKEG